VTSGLDLLGDWSVHATQSQRNVAYRIIFAVADRNVFTDYAVVDDVENYMEFFVLAKNDLVVKIRIDGFDSFAIFYIGPSCTAPGLDATPPASMRLVQESPGLAEETGTLAGALTHTPARVGLPQHACRTLKMLSSVPGGADARYDLGCE
jgi:hypothetical protein